MDMKEQILTAAVQLAPRLGLKGMTRIEVAKAANVANGSVSYHFKSMRKLYAAVVAKAIEGRNIPVLVRALAEEHPLAVKMEPDLKRAAARHLAATV